MPAKTARCDLMNSFQLVFWLRFGCPAPCHAAAGHCQQSGPTHGDRGWPALRRFGHIPSRSSPVPFERSTPPISARFGVCQIAAVFGSIELLGNQSPIPRQDRAGLLAPELASESFADLSEGGPFW